MKPLAKVTSVAEAIGHPELQERLHAALPRHMTAERMLRVFHLALQRTPKLAQADLRELLGALIGFAAIGIEPNTPLQHGWLIPFEKRRKNGQGQWETVGVDIQPIIGYRGFIDLSRRSGSLVSIHADVVYDGDDFSYEYGTDEHLRHRYGERDGDVLMPRYAYACAKVDGGHSFEVMPWRDVLRIRDGSQGYQVAKRSGGRMLETTPWVAHLDAMARKTPIRRLFKTLPTSIEQSVAITLDEMGERKRVRFGNLLDVSPGEATADSVAGLVEGEDYDDAPAQQIEDRREAPIQQQAEPQQEQAAAPQQARQAAGKPRGAGKAAKAAEPPAQEAEAAQEAPAAEQQATEGFRLVWPNGEAVDYTTAADAMASIRDALYEAADTAAIDALAKTAGPLRKASKGVEAALGDLFRVAREAMAATEDGDEPAEGDADADDAGPAGEDPPVEEVAAANAEAAAEAEAVVDWSVDLAACMDGDKLNTMKLMHALDSKSRECSSADDWHELVEQNGPALEALKAKLKRSYDNFMSRYQKATA
jgi:recombination protein RecT